MNTNEKKPISREEFERREREVEEANKLLGKTVEQNLTPEEQERAFQKAKERRESGNEK